MMDPRTGDVTDLGDDLTEALKRYEAEGEGKVLLIGDNEAIGSISADVKAQRRAAAKRARASRKRNRR